MAKTIKVDGEPKEVTKIRNKILKEFSDLEFIEDGHKYFLNGKQLPSVSQVTHKFKVEEDFNIVAFIGDGSITNGLAMEGLNNLSNCNNKVIIVLNDNDKQLKIFEMELKEMRGGMNGNGDEYLIKRT
jgi:deoxyxylulose-5-phosphate synthase